MATYSLEGCKLRIKMATKVRFLDFLLDEKMLSISGVKVPDLIGCIPQHKNVESYLDSIARHLNDGIEKQVSDVRFRTYRPEQVSLWWPYCKFCPPKGYNCMISLSYDFLDIFSELSILQKTIQHLLGRLERLKKNREIAELGTSSAIHKLSAFESWLQGELKQPLVEKILQRRISGRSLEDLILEEINLNIRASEELGFQGWPVVLNGNHRKEQVKDHRGLLVDIVLSNYASNKKVAQFFSFIQNLESRHELQEFANSNAKIIDPLTTAFVIKYLTFGADPEILSKRFKDIEKTINGCLEALWQLHEMPFNRNSSTLTIVYNQVEEKVFNGEKIPFSDGAWMNFEFMPDPSTILPMPDYSLSSTLDVANALMFIPVFRRGLNSRITAKIAELNESLLKYVIEERLEKAIQEKNNGVYRLDIAHWQDRYGTLCELSDVHGTIKMLDFILNLSMYYITMDNYRQAAALLFETPVFGENLSWLVAQQKEDGCWPPVSTEMLELALEEDSVMNTFRDYLEDIGFHIESKDRSLLHDKISKNKDKTTSYANTTECISLLSKYFATKIVLNFLS